MRDAASELSVTVTTLGNELKEAESALAAAGELASRGIKVKGLSSIALESFAAVLGDLLSPLVASAMRVLVAMPGGAQEVLEAYARCRERETLRTYRSAVTAFTNWLVTVKDNLEVKAMVAKILKHSGMPPTYKLDFKELAKSLEGPANMYCRAYSVVPESCKPQDEVRLGAHQESALWTF